MSGWYDRAFGPWYLKLYPHRDRAEAERALSSLERFLPAGGRVLDVACGPGRHSAVLAARGYAVSGLDRSRALLAEASRAPALGGALVRGDMRRLPFASRRFDAVLSMFTSFGYFGTAAEHVELLAEYARVTRPKGVLVLDYLNADAVERALVPESAREVDGHAVTERRWIARSDDANRVTKEVTIRRPDGVILDGYQESVALYERWRVLEMLDASGWVERASLGDYDASPWCATAARLLLVAERGRA